MSTRFVVVLDDRVTPQMNKDIGAAIKNEGAGWWHWYQHAWLIYDSQNRDTKWWQQRLKQVEPKPGFLIFNVDNGDWSGFTVKKYYEWLQSTWVGKPATKPEEEEAGA